MISKDNFRIGQSHPSDGLSFGRTFVSANHILRTEFRIGQSHPLDESSFGRTFVSANHILRTDHLLVGLSFRPIRILQTNLQTIFKSTSSSRPIRIFRTNPQDNQVTRMVTDHTSDETQKPRLSRKRHSNDLGSHERDGRKRSKKSPHAKAVRLRTH